MSNARNLSKLLGTDTQITTPDIADGVFQANKNLIINGAMQVAARGTNFSSISGSTYTLDRFAVRNATAVSQSTDVPSGQGFKNSLFYDSDGSRSSLNIRQPMEDVTRLLNDKAVTLSFWLKSSVATTISVDLCDANSTNVSVTTSWAKYEVTFPATSNLNSGNTYEAGAGWIDFNFGTGYPDVYLTGVQLELGSTATPFEHRSYGDELAKCQRYYGEYGNSSGVAVILASARTTDSGDIKWGTFSFPTQMRADPTTTIVSANLDGATNSTVQDSRKDSVTLRTNGGGSGGATTWIKQFKSDAEL